MLGKGDDRLDLDANRRRLLQQEVVSLVPSLPAAPEYLGQPADSPFHGVFDHGHHSIGVNPFSPRLEFDVLKARH